nr:hypothetical protein Iba_chr05dCG4330 [Ipomoea batatas]
MTTTSRAGVQNGALKPGLTCRDVRIRAVRRHEILKLGFGRCMHGPDPGGCTKKVLSILHWDFFDHACDSESFRFAVDNDSYTPGAKSNSYHGLGKSSAAKNMVGKAGLQQSESKGDNIFKSNQTFSLLRLDPIRTPFSAGGELTAVASAKNLTKILPENFQKDFNLAKANSKQLDEEIADKKERAIHESLVIMKRVSF